MVNILYLLVFVIIYHGLIDAFLKHVEEISEKIYKKSKRRILYKLFYIIVILVIVPYIIIDTIIGRMDE